MNVLVLDDQDRNLLRSLVNEAITNANRQIRDETEPSRIQRLQMVVTRLAKLEGELK